MDVRLGVAQSLDHELALGVLGHPCVVAFEGVEEPFPLQFGEERRIFGGLEDKCVLGKFG